MRRMLTAGGGMLCLLAGLTATGFLVEELWSSTPDRSVIGACLAVAALSGFLLSRLVGDGVLRAWRRLWPDIERPADHRPGVGRRSVAFALWLLACLLLVPGAAVGGHCLLVVGRILFELRDIAAADPRALVILLMVAAAYLLAATTVVSSSAIGAFFLSGLGYRLAHAESTSDRGETR